jgi:citrate/tricarballylate utilization protein
VVFSLFITMPHGKLLRGIYRYVVLVRYAKERRMMGQVV